MSNKNSTILFSGFGLTGSLLLRKLLNEELSFSSITIIDQSFTPTNKHLCFVEDIHFNNEYVLKQWNVLSMTHENGEKSTKKLHDKTYKLFDFNRFYNETIHICEEHPRISLIESEVQDINENKTSCQVHLKNDTILEADFIFNSTLLQSSSSALYQQFFGCVIETKEEQFDPSTAELMDFSISQNNGDISFKYVLPFTEKKALVEYTSILPKLDTKEIIKSKFLNMLHEQNVDIVCSESEEYGVIPMDLDSVSLANKHSKIVHLGLSGNKQRRSSGYLLQFALDELNETISVLNDHTVINTDQKKPIKELLDSIFLKVIRSNPHLGPKLFYAMFNHNSGDGFLNFMFGPMKLNNLLPVIQALPKWLFIKFAFLHAKQYVVKK